MFFIIAGCMGVCFSYGNILIEYTVLINADIKFNLKILG